MFIDKDEYLRVIVEFNDDYYSCPLRSDLNTCTVVPNSPINFCPYSKEMEDGTYRYAPPGGCPLTLYDEIIITTRR